MPEGVEGPNTALRCRRWVLGREECVIGLFDHSPRIRRVVQKTMLVVGVLGLCGFGLRVAQQSGVVTVSLDTDQKTADCALLGQAFEAGQVTAIEFVTAGCSQARLREMLVRRVQGNQRTAQHGSS